MVEVFEQSRTAAEFIKNMNEVFTPIPKERPIFWSIQDKIKTERKAVIKKAPKGRENKYAKEEK